MRPCAEISWSKSVEIIQSRVYYYCEIMLDISIKQYLKITHIVSSTVWHLPRDIFDLAIESLNKVRRLKKSQRVIAEKKAFNWAIIIKDTLKKSICLEI